MGRKTMVGGTLAERAWQLMGDGEWHDYDAVTRELMKVVPPGIAVRQAEVDRQQRGGGRNPGWVSPPVRKQNIDPLRQVATGQRTIVRQLLKNAAFEVTRDAPGVGRRIRMLRPLIYGGSRKGMPNKKRVSS